MKQMFKHHGQLKLAIRFLGNEHIMFFLSPWKHVLKLQLAGYREQRD